MDELGRKQFVEQFAAEWKPDQHVSMIGPTGRGKSTVGKALIANRPGRTMVLCPKGPDPTMANVGKVVRKWPPGLLFDNRPDSRGRLVVRVEPPLKKVEQFAAMRDHFRKAIETAFTQGDWTIYLDELGVAAHPRMMNLGALIEQVMVTGRSRRTTVLSAVQAPRWVPRATYDQAQHVLLWRQRDKESVRRISEISGTDTNEVKAAVMELDYHELLWVDATADKLYKVRAS